jgi:lysyl-tRNA synthetase, class II
MVGENGEPLSKNEQKRRLKELEKAKKAAEKAAAKSAAPVAEKKEKKDEGPELEEEDEDADPTKYFENRLAWVNNLKAEKVNPYPHKFDVTMQFAAYHAKFGTLADGAQASESVGIAGARELRLDHLYCGLAPQDCKTSIALRPAAQALE